jgi:hypothetical protein
MRKIYPKPFFYEYQSPDIYKKILTQKENIRSPIYKRTSLEFNKSNENNPTDFFIAGLGITAASIALLSIIFIII